MVVLWRYLCVAWSCGCIYFYRLLPQRVVCVWCVCVSESYWPQVIRVKKDTKITVTLNHTPSHSTNTPHCGPPAEGRDCHDKPCMNYCPSSVVSCLLMGEFDGSFAATCGAGPDRLKHLMCFTGEIVKPQKKTDGASCNSESKAPGYWLNSKYNSNLIPQVYVYSISTLMLV